MSRLLYSLGFSLIFLLANCSNEKKNSLASHKIATIPEASGISFCATSNTLVVANDEGSFYEITPTGTIVRHKKLGKYDFEGVVCNKKSFMFAIEEGALLKVDRKSLKKEYIPIKKNKSYHLSKKDGIEGIEKIEGNYYVTLQQKKKKDAKMLRLYIEGKEATIKEAITHRIIDSAGLAWHHNQLYIVSDKKDTLYRYTLKKQRIETKVPLPSFAQEGVTFDEEGNIYFADDNGAVFKYKTDTFSL